jgi:hypothetical protein
MIVTKVEKAAVWSAPEVYEMCLRDPIKLKSHFEKHYPPAATRLLSGGLRTVLDEPIISRYRVDEKMKFTALIW